MGSLPEIEFIHVRLTFNPAFCTDCLDVIAVYHPPNHIMLQPFLEYLDIYLSSLNANTKRIISGDLNICGLHNNVVSNQLFDIMRSYSYMPHISRVTRPNPSGQPTAIDHIWSNFGTSYDAGIIEDVFISDHLISFSFLPLQFEKVKVKSTFRNHSEQCIQNLVDSLVNFHLFYPLLTANLDYDAKFDLFYDEIHRLYKRCCPIIIK